MISHLTVSVDAKTLHIRSATGENADITASTLRSSAMDAASRRERILNGHVSVPDGLKITAVTTMGSTGVNIQFSDGHQKAIFPYPLLRKIAFGADN